MDRGDYDYIWQLPAWPGWRYNLALLAHPLAEACRAQGRLLGRLAEAGLGLRDQACLAATTDEVLKTSAIEGERLDAASVRSSIARRLGVDIGVLTPPDRQVDGVVEMVLDATGRCDAPVTLERLFGWHASLFPTGYSGVNRIRAGALRDDAYGRMQVVSGPVGRQKIHFEAPPAALLEAEMARFLEWLNGESELHPVIKAGLAHLWFVTLHPFEDGNGRIGRALSELLLSRADGSVRRFYSMSSQIERERREYYAILERTERGTLEVSAWLLWFLGTLHRAILAAEGTVDAVLVKARFWQRWAGTAMNARQMKLLNRLLDGFEGKLTSSKWAAMGKCSQDTALRDIHALLALGVLQRTAGSGRSTGYALNEEAFAESD